MPASKKQGERHDWLGDAAESYVRYLFASEGFHAYGASKWHADIAVYDPKHRKWWQVEVKSTDRGTGKVYRKPLNNLFRKADLAALVRLSAGKKIDVQLVRKNPPAAKNYQKAFVGGGKGSIRSFLYNL